MVCDDKLLIGRSGEKDIYIYPAMANRHGLIAGATGTGKTVTLKVMAESFSSMGVPVFMADAKGDLTGTCLEGTDKGAVSERAKDMGLVERGFTYSGFPVNFWDVFGEKGMPLRTTVSEMGPVLLARILDLNEIQSDILRIIFTIADSEGLLLIDIKDLKAMLRFVGEHSKEYSAEYGNIAKQSLDAITRAVVALESEGAESFFGEPALNITDWLACDCKGRGFIQILECSRLMLNPTLYSMFMLWLMNELLETLPEVGDCEKPKLVFFFDEAHMLFDGAPKTLVAKIAQVVKLIRSKGVGIYFISQNPDDIPGDILSQLGNKIQHALRAYTPAELKGVKAAVGSLRANPSFDSYTVLSELGTGEALVSVLGPDGVPTVVERTVILPPMSALGAADEASIEKALKGSLLYSKYAGFFDRDSAYEFLQRHAVEEERVKAEREEEELAQKAAKEEEKKTARFNLEEAQAKAKAEKEALKEKQKKQNETKKALKSTAKTVTGTIGRQIGKSLGSAIGGSFGKTLGGNLGASLGRNILGIFGK